MKLPALHKYFSTNIFFYLIFLNALSLHCRFEFWIGSNFDYLWVPFLPINAITTILIPITIVFIIIELLLRKIKIIKSVNVVTLSAKTIKIIYSCAILAAIYILWFWIYYYPILEKRLKFD